MRPEVLGKKTHLYLIALLFSILVPLLFLENIARFPRGLMTDDSYFYANIAYNIGVNGFSSFDGVNPTDGYHLLWCWILAGVSFLLSPFTLTKSTHLAFMIGTYLFLCCFIGIYFGKKKHHVFFLFSFGIILKIMMDSTLVALLLLLFLSHYFVSTEKKSHPAWMFVLLLLVPLARIDATVFIFVLSLYFLIVDKSLRQFLFVNISMTIGVILQVLGNWLTAGSVTSVSAELKTTAFLNIAANLRANITRGYYSGYILLAIFLVFLTLSLLAVLGMKDSTERKKYFFIALSATSFVVLHLCTNTHVRYWYYIPSLFMFLYILLNVSNTYKFIGWATNAFAIVAISSFCVKYVVDTEIRAEEIKHSKTFVQNLRNYLPKHEPIFELDATGYVGVFSDRTIINGDGLVNTHAYARRLMKNQLDGYLEENNIRYIIHNEYPKDGFVLDYRGLKIREEDVETVIKPPTGLVHTTAFGLYRLKSPRDLTKNE